MIAHMDLRTTVRDGLERVGMLNRAKFVRGLVDPVARRAAADDVGLITALSVVLREDSNCVDVGAHKGSVLEHLVRLAPRGRHTAFEPLPELASQLRARFPNVDVRQAAVADAPGLSSFVHVLNRPDYSGLQRRDVPGQADTATISVAVETLDNVLDPELPIDFIKIDVEGGGAGCAPGSATHPAQISPGCCLRARSRGRRPLRHYSRTGLQPAVRCRTSDLRLRRWRPLRPRGAAPSLRRWVSVELLRPRLSPDPPRK